MTTTVATTSSALPAAVAAPSAEAAQVAPTSGTGMVATMPAQTTVAGATLAQPSLGNVVQKALLGTAVGGALGFASGMFVPFIPGGPLISSIVGAGAGLVTGVVAGIVSNHHRTTAIQQAMGLGAGQYLGSTGSGTVQNTAPTATRTQVEATGATFGPGDSDPKVAATQRLLVKVGLLHEKVTGTMDEATVDAIKHYEAMKGASPSGESTPAVRQALTLDARNAAQFAS